VPAAQNEPAEVTGAVRLAGRAAQSGEPAMIRRDPIDPS
jgi:hypothetical protein